MFKLLLISIISILLITSCGENKQSNILEASQELAHEVEPISEIQLDIETANRLARLPLKCIDHKLPYKRPVTITSEADLVMPIVEHPAFYGCFDWHSAVHGHWSLIYLMKTFPDLDIAAEARAKLNQNLTKENIQTEVAYFNKNKYTKSFERTYGWAWVLKLQEELMDWEDEDAKRWAAHLQPLSDHIAQSYQDYLPKLVYPIRVGEHTNTAFGLSFAYDYAVAADDKDLLSAIKSNALRFYSDDKDCPISWEPSGYDFLSPCLQELDLMRKVLTNDEFQSWIQAFMPTLVDGQLTIEPGRVKDRTDGKLVHLDGVNFSRAWCLYPLRKNSHAQAIANQHMSYSIDNISDGNYAGEHWLASFALYALKTMGQ